MDKTKENILKLAKESGIGEKEFLVLLKTIGVSGKFDPSLWEEYLRIIRFWRSTHCEVCGIELVIDHHWEMSGFYGKSKYRCPASRTHTVASWVATVIMKFNKCTRQQALDWALGDKCKHNIYVAECHECYELRKEIDQWAAV